MTDKKEPSPGDRLAAAQAFMDAVMTAAEQNAIPADIAFGLFGKLAKSAVNAAVDKGADRDETTFSIIYSFMQGLGVEVQALSVQARTGDGRAPPTTH